MPVLPCLGGDGRGAHGVGWPAVSPPWGLSIRRPPKVCQRRAELISNWLCPITAGQSRHSFEQFVRAIRSEVFFPLSFPFPRSLGITGARLQKIAFCVLLAHLDARILRIRLQTTFRLQFFLLMRIMVVLILFPWIFFVFLHMFLRIDCTTVWILDFCFESQS